MVVWNLNDLYLPSEESKLKEELNDKVNKLVSLKNELNPEIGEEKFIELLKEYEEINRLAGILSSRPSLQLCENVTSQELIKQDTSMNSFMTAIGNKLIFFTHFIKDLDEDNANRLIRSSGKYEYFLKKIRKGKEHSRTEEEEKIINIKDLSGSNALSNIRNLIVGKMIFKFQGKELTEEEILKFVKSENEDEREEAYRSLFEEYRLREELLGEVYKNLSLDWYNESIEIRHYKSSIGARNFKNTVSDETVDLVLNIIKENVGLFKEYFELKSKVIGYKNNRFNLYAPYILKNKKTYSFEKAKEITLETYKGFSEEAYILAKNIFDENHIHSELKENKRGGAFCSSITKDVTPYVLLNYNNELKDVSTLCHEIGHGIHGQISKDKNEFTFHSKLPLAETASIFGELLLTKHLWKTADKNEKIFLLFDQIDGVYASVIRQAYFVLFEREAHEKIKNGTTVEELRNVWFDGLKEQFGNMEIDGAFSYEWVRIPHIFETPFYCYAYAFANLVVIALYKMYEKEGEPFVEKYLNILRSGGDSDIPDILNRAGINCNDRAFWQGAFDKLKEDIDLLKELVDE